MRLANGNTSLRCEFCCTMVPFAPDETGMQILDETPELECPSCDTSLWSAVLTGVPIHACKRCHGMLVAMGALQALIDEMREKHRDRETPAPADRADLDRRISCPRCHQRMNSDFYAGGGNAVISGCEHCEVNWMEDAALMRIVCAQPANRVEAPW